MFLKLSAELSHCFRYQGRGQRGRMPAPPTEPLSVSGDKEQQMHSQVNSFSTGEHTKHIARNVELYPGWEIGIG